MKFTFIHSLEELGTDLRVGVSLYDGKEIYYITGIDADNPDRLVPMSFTCSSGVAMGDLIGPVEHIDNIPDPKEIISSIEETYSEIKSLVLSVDSIDDPIDKVKIINTILLISERLFTSKVGSTENRNLLALPLIVEVISGIIKSGSKYNFKKSDKILASLKKYQKSLSYFAEEVMFYEKNSDPAIALSKIDWNKIPSLSYSGQITLMLNSPYSEPKYFESFLPATFDDLISYLCSRYVQFSHFQCCSNCRRYFAFATDSKIKNCPRVIETARYTKDIGKTCFDVGRLRSHVRGLYSDETQVLYQRNYKATFARKKKGQVSEDHFAAWSEVARAMRDLCLAGEISYDELEKWFKDNYLRE